jgi:hypothetical protein
MFAPFVSSYSSDFFPSGFQTKMLNTEYDEELAVNASTGVCLRMGRRKAEGSWIMCMVEVRDGSVPAYILLRFLLKNVVM